MAEETKRDERVFQELTVRTESRTPTRDSPVRIISPAPKTPTAAPSAPVGRDWAAAVDLINEAAEAVRLADERANSAERYSQELAQYYNEQAKTADAKIASLEKRLESSEAKAREAEEWLIRFHDTIMKGFGGLLKKAS
ncbi:hypothetical protein [Methylovirgula sp. HY1]|uniref:hypothetical protein n=1 Tax=Methylovirgula sp. HY1 TaxID=2822761 RepID=UPI001C5A5B4B|nr:hypothetical protein [Methylovirgula sp. HY1]QXX73604.1 hypothetical protein MHY1_00401 [Methylovirgula sp. HY1]